MNNLTEERRNQLKIAVLLFLVLFAVTYCFYLYLKYFSHGQTIKPTKQVGEVVFTQPILQFFNFKQTLNEYPDRITIHFPYLVIIRPDKFQSEIYNMQTQRKEKTINQVLLDYYNGNFVYNKQGFKTFYNNTDLGLLCDEAFIKSTTDLLCITRPDQNESKNKLISINPQTLEQKDIYKSQNVLTAVYFDKDTTYLGEYNLDTKKAFITVNNKTAPISDWVNIIYPMQNNFYAASFKSVRNNHIESYYEINDSVNTLKIRLIEKNKVVLY